MPWDAAWRITQLTGGDVRFVLASSGHIAGIINPPGGKRRLLDQRVRQPAATPEEWRGVPRPARGQLVDRLDRLAGRALGGKVKPPAVGSEQHPPLDDAPGTYVMEK